MDLFFFYCFPGFSNCYVLGSGGGESPEAVIVDPGSMEDKLLECIENNSYNVRAVLVTHEHKRHIYGLRTLSRIYDTEVFAINGTIGDCRATQVKDGERLTVGAFNVEVIAIPGHSPDSVVYRIDNLLFTGDALTAGLVGSTASAYGAATQMSMLRNRLLSLPGDYTVLPGHGPPSSLEAERNFNVGILMHKDIHSRRPAFSVGI